VIYLNGQLVSPEDAAIDPTDRGFLLGDGLFETLRAYGGRVPWLDRHLDRLAAGAAVLGIPLPALDLGAAVVETLEANDLATADAALRITLTRGPGPRGLVPLATPRPTLMIAAHPLQSPAGAPLRAMIAATRRNEHSPLANLKSLNYLDNVLAHREAAAAGANDGLLLNTAGRLASASAGNLFLVRQRTLLTPPTSEGVLPGITRAVVLDLAPELGLTAVETPLEPDQLDQAHEAFVTNSLIELRPLVAVDGRPIGDGAPGPATDRLLQAYRERLAGEL
jgi:branched-chain amino acid aminotransferase